MIHWYPDPDDPPATHDGRDKEAFMPSIREWQQTVHQLAVEKGWWEAGDRNVGEQIALMHAELSEALEEYRAGHGLADVYYAGDSLKPEGFGMELADVVIRIMDTCERYGIDLEGAIQTKHAYNTTRGYRHGGKVA